MQLEGAEKAGLLSAGTGLKSLENATKYSYFEFLSKKEKLIARSLEMPSDFHYEDMVKLLGYFGFKEVKKGKTSGSRVKFENGEGVPVMPHKPHPSGIMKEYQMKQVKELLKL